MQDNADLAGAIDHVMVGDHRAIARNNHTGTERTFNTLARGAKSTTETIAKELLEERVVEERRALALFDDLLGVDVDNRRGGLFDQWRKRHLDVRLA